MLATVWIVVIVVCLSVAVVVGLGVGLGVGLRQAPEESQAKRVLLNEPPSDALWPKASLDEQLDNNANDIETNLPDKTDQDVDQQSLDTDNVEEEDVNQQDSLTLLSNDSVLTMPIGNYSNSMLTMPINYSDSMLTMPIGNYSDSVLTMPINYSDSVLTVPIDYSDQELAPLEPNNWFSSFSVRPMNFDDNGAGTNANTDAQADGLP